MKNSLELLVATYFEQLFKTDSVLRKKQFRHSDSERAAEPNVITIEAKQGEDILEGPRGQNGEKRSKVEVTASYRSATASPHDNDLVIDAMQNCIRTANRRHTAAQKTRGFFLLIMNEDIGADRNHTKSTRIRELTIPCEAGLLA